MKNKLTDLNDHLFAQLERLADENLTPEQIDREAKRGEAMVRVADQIIRNAALQLQTARLAFDAGDDPTPYLPAPAKVAQANQASQVANTPAIIPRRRAS